MSCSLLSSTPTTLSFLLFNHFALVALVALVAYVPNDALAPLVAVVTWIPWFPGCLVAIFEFCHFLPHHEPYLLTGLTGTTVLKHNLTEIIPKMGEISSS